MVGMMPRGAVRGCDRGLLGSWAWPKLIKSRSLHPGPYGNLTTLCCQLPAEARRSRTHGNSVLPTSSFPT